MLIFELSKHFFKLIFPLPENDIGCPFGCRTMDYLQEAKREISIPFTARRNGNRYTCYKCRQHTNVSLRGRIGLWLEHGRKARFIADLPKSNPNKERDFGE